MKYIFIHFTITRYFLRYLFCTDNYFFELYGVKMKNLTGNVKTRFDRINKNANGVKARLRPLKKGGFSIYLDIHQNKERSYEKTEFEIFNTPDAAAKDSETLNLLKDLVQEKEKKMLTQKITTIKSVFTAVEFFAEFAKTKKSMSEFKNCIKHFQFFCQINKIENIMLKDIDVDIAEKFHAFLETTELLYKGEKIPNTRLAQNTKAHYFTAFKTMLSAALKKKLITEHPAEKLSISIQETNPEYLTVDEMKKLINTKMNFSNDIVSAFLFTCFTGLRKVDIVNLKFTDIKENQIQIRQQKTTNYVYVPLSADAQKIIELQKQKCYENDIVFQLPIALNYINEKLNEWFKKAGIELTNRHITYHSARHTFAMLLLDAGIQIQNISKLLGHKSINTTMIYQKIKDKELKNSINAMPSFFTTK